MKSAKSLGFAALLPPPLLTRRSSGARTSGVGPKRQITVSNGLVGYRDQSRPFADVAAPTAHDPLQTRVARLAQRLDIRFSQVIFSQVIGDASCAVEQRMSPGPPL